MEYNENVSIGLHVTIQALCIDVFLTEETVSIDNASMDHAK